MLGSMRQPLSEQEVEGITGTEAQCAHHQEGHQSHVVGGDGQEGQAGAEAHQQERPVGEPGGAHRARAGDGRESQQRADQPQGGPQCRFHDREDTSLR
jgi:hypothetical protein